MIAERARILRRTFRYLKRGVFPPESIDDFTLGRGAELAAINSRLEDVQGGSSRHVFIEGAYGRGKSHMLKAIEAIALRKGFGVCWVTLDGQNHACNHPTRYLHSLLESLRVPGSAIRGLASLAKYWLRGEKSDQVVAWARQSTSWLSYPIFAYQRNPDAAEESSTFNAWIESRDITHKNGKLWFDMVRQRMQATAALLRAVGLNGIVYLFDELETVATLLSSARQRFLSYAFLNLLIDGRKHPHCFFAFAATPDFGIKLTLDSRYTEHYENEYSDACRFVQKWQGSSVDTMELRRLKRGDVVNLCRRLRGYHEEAFMWSLSGRFSDQFLDVFVSETERLNMGTRDVIRSMVHLLELAEQHPTVDVEDALLITNK